MFRNLFFLLISPNDDEKLLLLWYNFSLLKHFITSSQCLCMLMSKYVLINERTKVQTLFEMIFIKTDKRSLKNHIKGTKSHYIKVSLMARDCGRTRQSFKELFKKHHSMIIFIHVNSTGISNSSHQILFSTISLTLVLDVGYMALDALQSSWKHNGGVILPGTLLSEAFKTSQSA